MADYDFHTLSPADFEDLARDLLQARDGVVFESYKAGRDGGIDAYRTHPDGRTVVQCKHYAKSGFTSLYRDLKPEVAKVDKMRPGLTRYVLATTVELSKANKDKIAALFSPVLATGDILGRDDLNNLLGLHPHIEQQNFKLWLSSTAVFERVVHNAAATKSEFDVERVRKNVRRFVRGAAYPAARQRLAAERIVIIAGTPGVGKTTLADILLYEYLNDGFKAISARDDFDQARELYKGGKAVFYYDDFLGATYLGEGGSPMQRNEDRKIKDYIDFVQGNVDTRLILTTRGHLFNQAINTSERLRHGMVDRHKLMVSMNDLNRSRRGRVLYNHIWFSDLPAEYRDVLLHDGFYLEIIEHAKFSPRLVEWLTDYVRLQHNGVTLANYKVFVRRLLEDPSEIWVHAYTRQIGENGRSLLLALHALDGKATIDRLGSAFSRLHAGRAAAYGFARQPSDFQSALRDLTTTFVTIRQEVVSFLDPSVQDLMNLVLRTDPENGLDIIRHAVSISQIETIWGLARSRTAPALLNLLTANPATVAAGLATAIGTPTPLDTNTRSLEEIATLLTRMADELPSSDIAAMVEPILDQVRTEWTFYDDLDWGQAVLMIDALSSAQWVSPALSQSHIEPLTPMLLSRVDTGIDPDNAVLVMSLVTTPSDHAAAFETGLNHWMIGNFAERLDEMRSSPDYVGFIDALKTVQKELGLDLEDRIDAVQTRLDEHIEHEEAYADQAYDSYKDARAEQDFAEADMRDLFRGLSGNG